MAARKASPKARTRASSKKSPDGSERTRSVPPRARLSKPPSKPVEKPKAQAAETGTANKTNGLEAPVPDVVDIEPEEVDAELEPEVEEVLEPEVEAKLESKGPPAPPKRGSTKPPSQTPPPPSARPPKMGSTPPPPRRMSSLGAKGPKGLTPPPPSLRMTPGAPSVAPTNSPLPPPVRASAPAAVSQPPKPPARPSRGAPASAVAVNGEPAVPPPAPRRRPTTGSGVTRSGAVAVAATPVLSHRAYSRVVDSSEVTTPSLSDRAATAKELVSVCEKQLKVEKSRPRQARLCYEMARLYEGPLADLEAAHRYYQKAHGLDPQFEPILSGLIRVRARLGQWEGTLKPLEEQSELSRTPEDKAALLFVRGVVQEVHLERLSDARADFERAQRLCPDDSSLVQAVERHARREQDYKALDAALSTFSQLTGTDRGLTSAVVAERARVAEQFRKHPKEAAQYYEQAFSNDPLASSAAYSLEHLLFQEKQFAAHARLLKRRAELTSNAPARASSLSVAAALLVEACGELSAGAELLEAAWQSHPDDLGLLRTLADVYERAGEFSGMVSALARLEQRTADAKESAELCVVIGETMTRRLGKKDEAVAYFEKARRHNPGDPACVAPLCDYFEERGQWQQLVTALGEEEAASDSRHRRADLHRRMARIFENQLASPKQAIVHHRSALGLIPEDDAAFRELARLLESEQSYEELVELHERAAEMTSNEEVRFAHLFKTGQILEDLLGAPQRAVSVYQRILEQRADHLGAFFALQRAAARAKDSETLIKALVDESQVHDRATEKLPLLHRAGEVALEDLGKTSLSLDLFGQVLAIDKHYPPTLRSLADHYEKAGRESELLEILQLQVAGLETDQERGEHLMRMGRISEGALGDDEKALGYYQRAHQTIPQAKAPAAAVRRCLARLGRVDELTAFLSESLKAMEAGPERARLYVQLGQLHEMRLSKTPAALLAYEKALEDQPDNAPAADGRVRVLDQKGDPLKTADALRERGEASGDSAVKMWTALRRGELLETFDRSGTAAIEIYESVLSDLPHQPSALLALCRLYEAKGNEEELARVLRLAETAHAERSNKAALLRHSLILLERHLEPSRAAEGGASEAIPNEVSALLKIRPADRAALRHAEATAALSQRAEDLALVDEHYVQVLPQGPLRAAHRTRLGEYLEPRNPAQALEQHRPALAEDAENLGAARGVSRVAEVIEESELLIEAAKNEATIVLDEERAAAQYVRAAEILERSGDPARAASVLSQALSVCPESVDAASAIYELLAPRGEIDELLAILTEAAEKSRLSELAAEHWVAVAKLYADEKNDLPAAIAALSRLEKAGKANLAALLELSELYLRDRQWAQAVDRLRKAAALKPKESVLVAVRLRLAEVLDEKLHRVTDATRELREVLQINGEHPGALRRLLAIQMKEGSQAALETAQKLVGVSNGPERAEALTAQGKLLTKAHKPQDALSAYAGAVALIGLEPPDASQGLRAILQSGKASEEAFSRYEKALAEFAQRCPPGDHQARVFLELARVVSRRDETEAARILGQGLSQNPRDQALRLQLVSKLKATRRYQEALPELTKLLRSEPLRAKTWEDLVQVYDALGQNAAAHLATGPLVLLGQGTELQQSAWRNRQPEPALLGPSAFSAQVLAETLREGVSLDALALLEALSGTISKVMPPNLEALGTSTRNRVPPRGSHPVRNVLDRVVHCLGGPEVDLYFSDSATRMHVLLTDPVGILVPVSFTGLPESDQVFYLSCFAANIVRHAACVDALELVELKLLLGAGKRLADPSVDVPDVDPEELAQTTRRLQKSLPWLSRGRIEDAARRFAAAPTVDVAQFAHLLKESARRAAVILADDIRPVLQLAEGQGRLIGIEPEESTAVIGDLLPYWASAESIAVRQAIGSLR